MTRFFSDLCVTRRTTARSCRSPRSCRTRSRRSPASGEPPRHAAPRCDRRARWGAPRSRSERVGGYPWRAGRERDIGGALTRVRPEQAQPSRRRSEPTSGRPAAASTASHASRPTSTPRRTGRDVRAGLRGSRPARLWSSASWRSPPARRSRWRDPRRQVAASCAGACGAEPGSRRAGALVLTAGRSPRCPTTAGLVRRRPTGSRGRARLAHRVGPAGVVARPANLHQGRVIVGDWPCRRCTRSSAQASRACCCREGASKARPSSRSAIVLLRRLALTAATFGSPLDSRPVPSSGGTSARPGVVRARSLDGHGCAEPLRPWFRSVSCPPCMQTGRSTACGGWAGTPRRARHVAGGVRRLDGRLRCYSSPPSGARPCSPGSYSGRLYALDAATGAATLVRLSAARADLGRVLVR